MLDSRKEEQSSVSIEWMMWQGHDYESCEWGNFELERRMIEKNVESHNSDG